MGGACSMQSKMKIFVNMFAKPEEWDKYGRFLPL
jgi:hypothetical protein